MKIVHLSIKLFAAPMQIGSKLTLLYTSDFSCPNPMSGGECQLVVWGECEARNVLTIASLHSTRHMLHAVTHTAG